MDLAIKIILILVYPFLLLGRLLNAALRRDPLRLREPQSASCWIDRGAEPTRTSYFSEASEREGVNHGGFGRIATAVLIWVAGLFAPPRKSAAKDFRPAAEREHGIPDEVYTLW